MTIITLTAEQEKLLDKKITQQKQWVEDLKQITWWPKMIQETFSENNQQFLEEKYLEANPEKSWGDYSEELFDTSDYHSWERDYITDLMCEIYALYIVQDDDYLNINLV